MTEKKVKGCWIIARGREKKDRKNILEHKQRTNTEAVGKWKKTEVMREYG